MTYPVSIQRALEVLKDAPLRPVDKEPPIHSLLWKFGIAAPPPILAGIFINALSIGSVFGLIMGILFGGIFSSMPSLAGVFGIALFAGIPAGLGIAALMENKRKKLGLPSWRDIKDTA